MKKITFLRLSFALVFVLFYVVTSQASDANSEKNSLETYACTGPIVNTFPYTESFNNTTGLWTQDTGDDANWSFDPNFTPSNQTGPANPTDGSHYMYFEASNPIAPGDVAIVTSPCIDLTGQATAFFTFDYHMFASNAEMGTLNIDVSDNAGTTWTNVFTRSGPVQTSSNAQWITQSINLNAYLGTTINIRIRGIRGSGFRSDMAVDNVNISSTPRYCNSTANNTDSSGITRVIFNTIDNSTAPANQGYSNFTALSTTVIQGATHNLTVHNNTLGNNTFNTRVWVDWNQDFDFNDAGETYNLGSVANTANGPTSNSPLAITVPAGAALGNTRMRVSSFFNAIPTSCLTTIVGSGEVEDYTINVISTVPQPEIAITGLGILINSGDTTPTTIDNTDFGTIAAGGTLNHTFTITNSGTLPLTLSGASLTGTGAGEYAITTAPPATIAAGSSSNFVITYTPANGGTHDAIFSITTNDSDENPYTFHITGLASGPQPEIALDGMGNQIIDGSTTPLLSNGTDFGAVLIAGSQVHTFNINNIGTANLNLTSASPHISISGSPYFSITAVPTSTSIPGGGSTTFEITYTPLVVGTHTATVSILSNDSDESPFDFTIVGQSVATASPEIDIAGNGLSIVDGDTTPNTADNTDFGNAFIGISITKDFVITNSGTNDLNLTGTPLVQIQGAGNTEYSVTSLPNATIPAGGSTIFQVTYSPTTVGTHNPTIRVQSNDADENNYTFDITGSALIDTTPQYTIYYEGFDTNNGGWIASNPGGNTVWTYGTNGVETGTEGNYWYTNNYDDYASNSNTYATSPTIDLSGFQNLRLQIDIRYVTEQDFDGMRVEYNSGSGWTVLGAYAVTPLDHWYNTDNLAAFGTGEDGWSGTNTGGAGSGRSDFLRASIALPAALNNNANAQLRVRFASNGSLVSDGANFDNVVILGDPLTPFGNPLEGPASVTSNLKLWLKSNAGTGGATSGNQINSWGDSAFDNNAVVANNDAPIYYNDPIENINHNPVLDFNTANDTELKGKGGFYTDDYWVVIQSDGTISSSNSLEGIVAGRISNTQFAEDGTGIWINPGSIRFFGIDNIISHMIGSTPATVGATSDGSYGRTYGSATDTMTNEVLILNVKYNASLNQSEIYRNGEQIDTHTGRAFNQATSTQGGNLLYSTVKNSSYALGVGRITIGGTPFDSHFNGKMTEFISYAAPSSTLDQKKIQSYLALKNGVTLHSINTTTPKREGDEDYVDSDGNIYWDTTIHAGYNYDIAGIGRDIAATLDQRQSTSSNAGATLTMGLTDIYNTNDDNISLNTNVINDKNFLVWGNNNESFGAAAPIAVDMSAGIAGLSTPVDFSSIRRSWKVVETGSIGAVKISIPEVSLSATITPPGNFLMFVSDTPSFSPTSEYRVLTSNGANLETTYDFIGTKYITFGYAPEYFYERAITFDGAQDYMDADDVADLSGAFTISAWVKRGSGSNNTEIVSKRNLAPWTEGYALTINNTGRPNMLWRDSGGVSHSLATSVPLPVDEWHHVAVVHNGTAATFFIDGFQDLSLTAPIPTTSDQHFMIAAGDYINPANFFDGTIDEVRVWNQALSTEQLRYIMNQEIERFSDDSVNGKIIPQNISKNEVASIPWANLEMYLPMNRYTFTNVKDESNNNHVAAIRNLETVDFQTAPIPYRSAVHGNYYIDSTWANSATQQSPGSPSIVDPTQTVDWNIVQTSHNINADDYTFLLGLDVQTNKFSVTGDHFLNITHYLKLDGIIDLEGESQLIQTENSDLDPTSVGQLERDQQGTSDTYSYNFYSSPVGAINATAINQAYTIGSMMNDGTVPANPLPLNFSGGFDGAPTSPITISAYWMFKFANTAGGNNDWSYTGPFGSIDVGLGYTMKGPGTGGVTDDQNYTFIGKPNNSTSAVTISHPISAGNNTLVGNPFPSTLDADQFINDNTHLSGTLYFWEHWGGGSHILAEYEGGYAMYSLSGGIPAVSHPLVANAGVGTKTPTSNVGVAQGFFVTANADGNIEFNNRQRKFALESVDSVFFFGIPQGDVAQNNLVQNNEEVDPYTLPDEDIRPKFRIGYDSSQQYHRQLLLTVDSNATYNLDSGYDAIILDAPSEDMSWYLEEKNVGIQGVPNITEQAEFPLRVLTSVDGVIKIGIDRLENVDETQTVVYLKDHLLDETYNLYSAPHEVYIEAGEYTSRFSIVFVPVEDETTEDTTEDETTDEDTDDESDTEDSEDSEEEEEDTSDQDTNEEEEETGNESENEDTDTDTDTDSDQDDTDEGQEEESDTETTDDDTDESSEDTTEDTEIDLETQLEVIEIASDTEEELMDLNEMYAGYNGENSTIIIQKNPDNEFRSIRLYTMLSQMIRTWNPDKNATEVQLPTNNLSTGVYILIVETEIGRMTKKLIIH